MKNKTKVLVLIIFLFVGACAALIWQNGDYKKAQVRLAKHQSVPATPELSKILDAEWQAYKKDKPNLDGGLAMQILSPKGDYFVSTGMGDDMDNGHHFRIASVTKTFTASGIMLLHQKGMLNINDKITDNIPGTNVSYLPDTPAYDVPYKKDITIKMLLMHRAGIFDPSNDPMPENKYSRNKPYVGLNYIPYIENMDKNHTFTFDEMVGLNAANHLSYFEPGSSYHYSNTGYSMLGKIIERVSGQSYAEFITQNLLVPNGLTSSKVVYKGDDQDLPEPFVKGYIWADGEIEEVTQSNVSANVAEGNIISTPLELAQWGNRLFTGQAGLSKETVGMMMSGMPAESKTTAVANFKYGLGIIETAPNKFGHNGAHEGYLTNMVYNTQTGVTYVIFTNVWNCETCSRSLESIAGDLNMMTTAADKVLKELGY